MGSWVARSIKTFKRVLRLFRLGKKADFCMLSICLMMKRDCSAAFKSSLRYNQKCFFAIRANPWR